MLARPRFAELDISARPRVDMNEFYRGAASSDWSTNSMSTGKSGVNAEEETEAEEEEDDELEYQE
jgi:hypothetical protein